MPDHVVTPKLAAALHQRAVELGSFPKWEVIDDGPELSGVLLARLITDHGRTPYVLIAPSLKSLRTKFPPGLTRTDPSPVDPPEVVEVWLNQTQHS